MNPKRFWGRDMGEALRAVRGSLGADALIKETKNLSKELGGGVEIVALAEGPLDDADEATEEAVVAPQVTRFQPMDELRHELAALKSMLSWLAPGLNHQDQIVRALVAHGVAPECIAQLSEAMKQSPGGDERERWYRALAQLIPTGCELSAERDRLALIGPTGAGKTLSLIKLTTDELQRRQRRIGWIGMDQRGLAGVDPLATYAGILGVSYERAADRKSLIESLQRLDDCDLLFIDTPGVNPRDPRSVKSLAKTFHNLAEVRRTLVLSAVTNGADLTDWVAYFRPVGAQSLLFTKLDECRFFGPLFNTALAAALPVSYLSLGQNLSGDLVVARSQVFASLLLMGVESDV